MQAVFKLFKKKTVGVWKHPPPSRDRVKDFQVVIKVSSFLRNKNQISLEANILKLI